ncbi:unnamed protein product [Zymoseptoria tritici ST99CH_1A5]|uniref:RNA helicase n=4 Tax=Zymoseptoria tritici TaxID=1047171 RepID=F9WWH6_ZYMTI|nr:ATP-dependent RNA helicase [Zymoseptoria tritici IPO323]SMQ45761.1 unnamed protein product [Zymoseptoria tritici ST99CH_3D7]SMR42106.1 unnamed protein product [Zymoseptoria tritici ST99CH_1E4]SMR44287.1 unnamed protein product [Zymoseptoria tritici ST99CH_3D1]SMY19442.1 unnamed protein product [Zymoseptoria tritici ST99CH_1A5]EGP92400.1 hypothetical protein MYCGRDRAFT_65923 [Zymoseptoria tritici IPO323]
MSDDKPTSTEPELSKLSISAEPTEKSAEKPNTTGTNASAASFTPGKFSWADESTTPPNGAASDAPAADGKTLDDTQKDGATTWMLGSEGLDEPEFDVNVKLADLQEDPNNPLYSVKSFDELNLKTELQTGLKLMNFRQPSKIQERALPLLLKEPATNFIGQSQSGTGKTAAFVLNMLQRVDLSNSKPQAIVLAPTRELAKQIAAVATLMGAMLEGSGLKIHEAIPNVNTRNQQVDAQIVVGTPGTVMELLKRRLLDSRNIKVLTLDEADNMLDLQGMGDQCKRIKQQLPRNTQIVLFSATFPDIVKGFADVFAANANQITLEVEKLTVKGIKQMYLDCKNDEEKYSALVKFYGLMTIASSIIFVKRRDTAAEIERRMTAEGHKVASLTGALEGENRDKVFARFRSGEAKVLITTNVLSRGIDVQTVTMVINYDIPETVDGQPDAETYLHRIGRTGRFGRTGAALSFVHDRRSWQALMAICKHFSVEPTKLDTTDWDNVEKLLKQVMKNSRNAVSMDSM